MLTGMTTIGTTAVPLSTASAQGSGNLTVKASPTNARPIWISGASTVTAEAAASTSGLRLDPGESYSTNIKDPSKLYAMSDQADQSATWALEYA